jgi:hypothetical protein
MPNDSAGLLCKSFVANITERIDNVSSLVSLVGSAEAIYFYCIGYCVCLKGIQPNDKNQHT